MAQQTINVGSSPNDGQGDPLRTAFTICNNNFTELYGIGGVTGIANGNSNISIIEDSTVSVSSTGVANVLVVSGTGATLQGLFTGNGIVSATGNIVSSGLFIGNGSQLTGVISSPAASQLTGNTLSPNVVISSLTSVGVLSSLSVTGNQYFNALTFLMSFMDSTFKVNTVRTEGSLYKKEDSFNSQHLFDTTHFYGDFGRTLKPGR
jgi:hypothetical protein